MYSTYTCTVQIYPSGPETSDRASSYGLGCSVANSIQDNSARLGKNSADPFCKINIFFYCFINLDHYLKILIESTSVKSQFFKEVIRESKGNKLFNN